MSTNGQIKFDLQLLSDEDLASAVRAALQTEEAPRFFAWLADALLDEQTRRIHERLSIKQVACYFNISTAAIRQLVARGEFPKPIGGGACGERWEKSVLDKWLNASCPRVNDENAIQD